MATAVRRRFEDERGYTEKRRKVVRNIEREVSCSSHKCYFDASFVEFEFGPSELNLYQYVGCECRSTWKKAKDKFILKNESEPKKGLLLLYSKDIDVRGLCWKEFEFDPTTTSFANVNENLTSQGDVVWVFDLNEQFWKSVQKECLHGQLSHSPTDSDFVEAMDFGKVQASVPPMLNATRYSIRRHKNAHITSIPCHNAPYHQPSNTVHRDIYKYKNTIFLLKK